MLNETFSSIFKHRVHDHLSGYGIRWRITGFCRIHTSQISSLRSLLPNRQFTFVWKERIQRNITVSCRINHSSRNIDKRWTRNDQVTKTISWSGSYKISQFCYLRSHPYFHPFVFVFPWFRQKNLTWWNFAWYNNLEFSFIIFFLFCLIDTLLVLGLDLNNRYRGLKYPTVRNFIHNLVFFWLTL